LTEDWLAPGTSIDEMVEGALEQIRNNRIEASKQPERRRAAVLLMCDLSERAWRRYQDGDIDFAGVAEELLAIPDAMLAAFPGLEDSDC
jgi:hypothetical protein